MSVFWMEMEHLVTSTFLLGDWYVKKLTDTRDAGRIVDPNPGDFIVAKGWDAFVLEVKSSEFDPFPLENIAKRKSQNTIITRALMRGLPILYAIGTKTYPLEFNLYSVHDILNLKNENPGGFLLPSNTPHIQGSRNLHPGEMKAFLMSRVREIKQKPIKKRPPKTEVVDWGSR
jgi:hypothetical protein